METQLITSIRLNPEYLEVNTTSMVILFPTRNQSNIKALNNLANSSMLSSKELLDLKDVKHLHIPAISVIEQEIFMNTIKALFIAMNVAVGLLLLSVMPYLILLVVAYYISKGYYDMEEDRQLLLSHYFTNDFTKSYNGEVTPSYALSIGWKATPEAKSNIDS